MSVLVLDSGVIVKWFVAEPYSAEARRIFAEYRAGRLSLIAPDFIHAEFGNIVWKKQPHQGFNPMDAADIIFDFRTRIRITLTSDADLLDDAYRLAVTHKRTVYDMLYLALSLREGCQFVTADERLANAIGGQFPNIVRLADWP